MIKGAALRSFLEWYGRERGRHELTRVVDAIDPMHRELFDPDQAALGVLASTWYPDPVVHALLEAIEVTLPPAIRSQVIADGGAHTMRSTLHGLYATLFRMMATPLRYARYAPMLWTMYYDTGTYAVDIVRGGEASARIERWSGHHRILCDINAAAAQVIFETMGCDDVSVKRLRCVDSGAPDCLFTIRWHRGSGG